MTVRAIYENGVFRPQEPVKLEEHTEVEVIIPAPSSPRFLFPPVGKNDHATIYGTSKSSGAPHPAVHPERLRSSNPQRDGGT